jgi:hypothetical protein
MGYTRAMSAAATAAQSDAGVAMETPGLAPKRVRR